MPVHTSLQRARTARTAVAALVAAAACWGVGTVVTKQVVDDVAPLTLLPLQLAASCTFLLAVAAVRREPLSWSPSVRRLAALGALNPGLAYALGLIGLTTITASLSVLLWALEPVVILLLAALVLREHVSAALAASIAVAITGVLLVVYQPGAAGDAAGITLTLVSIGCCALYTVLTRRLMLDDSSLNVVVAQQAVALVFAALLGLRRHGSRRHRLGPGRARRRGLAACGGLRGSVLRRGVLAVPDRAAPRPGVVRGRVPAADPGVRGGGRLPGGRAAGAAAVARRGRHRGRDRRDGRDRPAPAPRVDDPSPHATVGLTAPPRNPPSGPSSAR